jgi:hypothetical protein
MTPAEIIQDAAERYAQGYITDFRPVAEEVRNLVLEEAQAERDSLALRLEAAEKDVGRLDWLEAQDLNDIAVIRQTNNVVGINVGDGPCYGKTLRAAIDQARGADHG